MDKPELKPCPFCGGEAQMHTSHSWSAGGYWKASIVCIGACDSDTFQRATGAVKDDVQIEAAARWNRRTPESP